MCQECVNAFKGEVDRLKGELLALKVRLQQLEHVLADQNQSIGQLWNMTKEKVD